MFRFDLGIADATITLLRLAPQPAAATQNAHMHVFFLRALTLYRQSSAAPAVRAADMAPA